MKNIEKTIGQRIFAKDDQEFLEYLYLKYQAAFEGSGKAPNYQTIAKENQPYSAKSTK